MNWVESVKEIKKAQENNQLVIFVGAGVSANSGIPTWGGLIKAIAKEIGYNRCLGCKNNTDGCACSHCEEKFTQEEYLRIPEYFYQSRTEEEYYSFLTNILTTNSKSNPLDDEIIRILPTHIITTNYDSLLEDSSDINAQLYTVVSQDSELLSGAGARYIVKMHGDLNKPETMVLKESDYINYEQNHILISTFIKSLLINHTFVFVGYSLNDYNLNLIIGWINYFRKFHGVKNSPKNFFIASNTPGSFEEKRLGDRNIEVVDLSKLPISQSLNIPSALTYPSSRKLYAFLHCVADEKYFQHFLSLEDTLLEKYSVLKPYAKISFKDLLALHSWGATEKYGPELVFYDKDQYEALSALLSRKSELMDIFCRAGIKSISHISSNTELELEANVEDDNLFEASLENDYVGISRALNISHSSAQRAYYGNLLGWSRDELVKTLHEGANSNPTNDYISIILHKLRCRLVSISLLDRQLEKANELRRIINAVPPKIKLALGHIENLISTKSSRDNMDELLASHEKKYQYRTYTFYSNGTLTDLWKIQAYAYDYYHFFKGNYIPYDYFSEPEHYFSYYIKAMLCTWSPVAIPSKYDLFDIETQRDRYKLNAIDIDIIVKYCKPDNLTTWLKKYSVQELEVEETIDIVRKFVNLCESYARLQNMKWAKYIHTFIIVLCFIPLTNDQKVEITTAISDMLQTVSKVSSNFVVQNIDMLHYLANHFDHQNADDAKSLMLQSLLKENIYPDIIKTNTNKFSSIISIFSHQINETSKMELVDSINKESILKEKLNKIFFFRKIIPIEQYLHFLESNISTLSSGQVFQLVIDKIITYSNEVFEKMFNLISSEVTRRKERPWERSFPDILRENIDRLLILLLLEYDVALSRLSPYIEYSDHLEFMLGPETFDYKKVDTSDYMWENLILSDKYQEYFILHKNDLLSTLEPLFNMGVETQTQQKITYGMLLDKASLKSFGKH